MIRFAKKEDLPRVNELRKQVFDLHAAARPDVFKEEFTKELRDYVYTVYEDPRKKIAVEEDGGLIRAFAVLNHITRPENPFMHERDYLDIDEFCVDKTFRRQGIATEMIRFIRAYAEKEGFSRLELNMWEFNQEALRCYERAGFTTYRRYLEIRLDPQGGVNEKLTQRQPKVNADAVRLTPMTPEMYHEYCKEYENDPDLYLDPAKFVPYEYSEEKVERYLQRLRDLKRISLAIMLGDEIAGEIVLKNIEPRRQATMGLTLKNAGYKDRGIGTQAERLAVQYVFHELDIPVLYADTIRTNTRSQHVLEKVGFRFLREDEDFKYYEIRRE